MFQMLFLKIKLNLIELKIPQFYAVCAITIHKHNL